MEPDVLFGRNGCLTVHGIMVYTRKKATSVQLDNMEAHLRHCALCREAIRGFEAHHADDGLPHELHHLSGRIRERFLRYGKRPQRKRLVLTGFTLTMVLVLIILLYLLYRYLQIIR